MKSTKILLTTAILLLLFGVALLSFTACSLGDNFLGIFYDNVKRTVEVADNFESIVVELATSDVNLLPSEDEVCRVVSFDEKNNNYTVTVEDGVLKVSYTDERKWYDCVNISLDRSYVNIYLPRSEYETLAVEASTADVYVPSEFSFETVSVSVSTGSVYLAPSASGLIEVETSTGDISLFDLTAASINLSVSTGKIDITNVRAESAIRFDVDTGSAHLSDVECATLSSDGTTGDLYMDNVRVTDVFHASRSTGDITVAHSYAGQIRIQTSTGDVTFDLSDADQIDVETDTGDVEGVLLTPKIFIPRTSTGRIDVPETTSGGICRVTTSTGRIILKIAESNG
jgi:DUF4097 and DUF4098 domain-containing protein YvlB